MILLSLLPALLAAERALGRLDQALADPARRLVADAARRSAAAVIRLDGHRLDAHDFQRAPAAPEHAQGEAARAALLVPLFAQLPSGLTATLPPERTPRPARGGPGQGGGAMGRRGRGARLDCRTGGD
ncbi:hypothetical protein J2848_005798 [Azospirillum lipoferum]|uniref:Uncharacterized protein n=1 Tax=Azospirillum lipoferum TaxID=193 RepID=A0A5A9GH59_AZOLI|nr:MULTISPECIES: hypothetical protein [Azospirillum]KAA0593838.1 hypothetical protein FZ942_23465 [Azospirillum lipoferum]MCP1614095.1 hypothetical protein [Azospirillum lipoferum]MDW5536784.1 hypothetical protein [Azospirillum sp. NL1]